MFVSFRNPHILLAGCVQLLPADEAARALTPPYVD